MGWERASLIYILYTGGFTNFPVRYRGIRSARNVAPRRERDTENRLAATNQCTDRRTCCCWSACSRDCKCSGTCEADPRRPAYNRRCWSNTRSRRTPLVPRPRSRDSPGSCRTPSTWVCIYRHRSRRCRSRTRWTDRICARVPLEIRRIGQEIFSDKMSNYFRVGENKQNDETKGR